MNNWQESQIQALIAAGVDAVDAQAVVAQLAAMLPPGADPTKWIEYYIGYQVEPEHIQDARVAWFADDSVAPKWKRILDASE